MPMTVPSSPIMVARLPTGGEQREVSLEPVDLGVTAGLHGLERRFGAEDLRGDPREGGAADVEVSLQVEGVGPVDHAADPLVERARQRRPGPQGEEALADQREDQHRAEREAMHGRPAHLVPIREASIDAGSRFGPGSERRDRSDSDHRDSEEKRDDLAILHQARFSFRPANDRPARPSPIRSAVPGSGIGLIDTRSRSRL